MESCYSANHWGRQFQSLGFEVNLCLLAKLIRLWMGRCPKPCSSPERRGTEKRWFYVRIKKANPANWLKTQKLIQFPWIKGGVHICPC